MWDIKGCFPPLWPLFSGEKAGEEMPTPPTRSRAYPLYCILLLGLVTTGGMHVRHGAGWKMTQLWRQLGNAASERATRGLPSQSTPP